MAGFGRYTLHGRDSSRARGVTSVVPQCFVTMRIDWIIVSCVVLFLCLWMDRLAQRDPDTSWK